MVQKIDLAKKMSFGVQWLQKFNLGHGDLDMAPNFDRDPLEIATDPKNLVFDPKMSKMGRNQKSEI